MRYSPTKLAHGVVAEQLDRLGGVRDREAVLADEHRQQNVGMLGEPRREQHQVVRLLRVLGEELDRRRSRAPASSRSGRSGC